MIRANWHKLLLAAAAILTLFVVISVVLVSDRALEEPLPTLAPTWDAAQAGEAAVALNTTALPTPVPPEPTAVPTDTPTVAPTEPPTATATPTAEDTAAVPTQAPSATPLPPTQAPVQQPRVTVLQVSGGMPPAEPVPNVVVLRVEPAQLARLQADVRALGGTVEVVNPALGAVTVQVPDESAAEALSQTEYVQAAEPDYYVSAQLTATDPRISEQWSLSAMNIPLSLPDNLAPITVAVIDSGICADHPELSGKILGGHDFIEGDDTPQDEMGHGCAVAGIIAANWDGQGMAGVAPNARLLIYRVLNAQGSGRYSNVASAIVRAVDDGAQIINLSLGGVNPSQLLQDAVDYAISRGVLVIAAAGNSGSSSVLYPAAYPNVVSVGALDMDGTRALFSNTGKVELWAPGVNVLSLTLANGHTTMSGTSFAAPNVAGLAALEMARGRSLALGGNAGYGAEGEVLPIMTPTPLTSLRDIPSGVGRVEGWLAVQVGDHINRIDPARTAILLYSDDGFTYELQDVNGSVINYHNKRVAVVGRFSDQVSALSMESFGADAAIEVQLIDPLSEFNAQAVVGSKPFVNLLCRFNDITSGQRPVSYFTNMFANSYPGIDHYWRQVSFNQVNLSGTTTLNTWVTLPRPRASYMNGQNANLGLLARDCMSAADPYVNYNNYYGINMFFNDVLDCCAWGGSEWVNFDGLNTFKPTTWLPSWAHNYDVVVHEMGHAFGLPHSTGTASNRPSGMNIYVSRWDVMSAGGTGAVVSEHGALPIGTIGYHVDMLSWLSSSRKVTVGPGHALEVTLDRLINPTTSNPLLAILPINGSHNHFYTVEVRDIFAIYDQNVPARAVIIHRVY